MRNLQYVTLSRPFVDFILTTVEGGAVKKVTPASLTSAISNNFLLYDRWGDMLLDDSTLLIPSQRRLV